MAKELSRKVQRGWHPPAAHQDDVTSSTVLLLTYSLVTGSLISETLIPPVWSFGLPSVKTTAPSAAETAKVTSTTKPQLRLRVLSTWSREMTYILLSSRSHSRPPTLVKSIISGDSAGSAPDMTDPHENRSPRHNDRQSHSIPPVLTGWCQKATIDRIQADKASMVQMRSIASLIVGVWTER